MEQGFLGFWRLPQAAETMNGAYQAIEYTHYAAIPPSGNCYGYDWYAFPDSMTHTNNAAFAYQTINKFDSLYHVTNAMKTLSVPEQAILRDCTLQIYQEGPEYVLHFSAYVKGAGGMNIKEAF